MSVPETNNMDVLSKLWEQQKYQADMEELKKYAQQAQAQNVYSQWNSNSSASPYSGATISTSGVLNSGTYPQYTTTSTAEDEDHKQLAILQIVNLIANFGPTVTKKIVARFKIKITREEIDQIHKDLAKTIADDSDEELDKVINDVAKEFSGKESK